MPRPAQAELAAAVLLGLREELDTERTRAFLTTGTVHLLSISGLHVGILAGAMFWLMRRTPVPRGWAVGTIAVVTLLYMLMVDARPPVVRATVLVLIACGGLWLGRRALGMNSLAAAALVVLAINPAELFHVGAQLSFLCVGVIIWLARWLSRSEELERTRRILEHLITRNLDWWERSVRFVFRGAIDTTVVGIAIGLVTSPLVMARFHILSPVAMLLNAPLWLLASFSMLSGFVTLLLATVCPPAAYLCGWLCNLSFWLLEGGIELAERLPGSHFWVPGPADWWLCGFYGGLGLWAAFPQLRPPRRWCAALLAAWITVGFAVSAWPRPRDRLDCTFLSMGHGCAVLLELPSGRTMLYDAGQMGSPSVGAGPFPTSCGTAG